jgi:hypothetical protein
LVLLPLLNCSLLGTSERPVSSTPKRTLDVVQPSLIFPKSKVLTLDKTWMKLLERRFTKRELELFPDENMVVIAISKSEIWVFF